MVLMVMVMALAMAKATLACHHHCHSEVCLNAQCLHYAEVGAYAAASAALVDRFLSMITTVFLFLVPCSVCLLAYH